MLSKKMPMQKSETADVLLLQVLLLLLLLPSNITLGRHFQLGGPTCSLIRVLPLHQLLLAQSRARAPPITLLDGLRWVTRADEVISAPALQGTRLMLQLSDDYLIAFHKLLASGLQPGLELQQVTLRTFCRYLPSGPSAMPNGFPAIC